MRLTHAALLNDHFAVIDREDHGRYHIFSAADGPHADPHDHAEWGFWSEVKLGGYVEDVFDMDGTGWCGRITRKQGDRFRVEAGHIHRIVELLGDVCVTHVAPDVHTGAPHAWAYQFRPDGRYRRPVFGGEWERVD